MNRVGLLVTAEKNNLSMPVSDRIRILSKFYLFLTLFYKKVLVRQNVTFAQSHSNLPRKSLACATHARFGPLQFLGPAHLERLRVPSTAMKRGVDARW
jgi:hypothetical protein